MPDFPMLSFGHHIIPLLSLHGAAGGSDGKIRPSAVKAACKSAVRIHGVLKLAGRFELAIVPDTPDFFDPINVTTKARNQAWETIRETPHLQWVIPTRRPDRIASSLPPSWIGKGFRNLCIGHIADSGPDLADHLQALRRAPVPCRMLLLSSSSPPIDLPEDLESIHWVVFAGDPGAAAMAATIGSSCRQAGAAFLFHRSDGRPENASTIGASEDGSPWPTHPFGSNIDLTRPTIPGLMPDRATAPNIPVVPAAADPAPPAALARLAADRNTRTDHPPEPAAEMIGFEVVPAGIRHAVPLSPPPVADHSDHRDFARLDGIVRRGMATFIDVGLALAEIRDRELWRAGRHASWAEYCREVGGLSKTHANRMINSARITSRISEVAPIGVTPGNEAQVRPLARLKQPEQQVLAWTLAVERANGQPTAGTISEVVAELMAGESPREAAGLSPQQRRLDAFNRLRDAFHTKRPRKEIERLIAELGDQLQAP